MSTEMSDWREDWPDWRDDGTFVEIELDGGGRLFGRLCANDGFFNGEETVPIFSVLNPSGNVTSFAGLPMKRWRPMGK